MILDELVLQNVGVFSGQQTISLTPPDPDHPIVLIGGLNGGGKTTILDALQLALYGPLARLAGRRGSYENYLQGLIHRGAPPDADAAVELTFHVYREGAPHYYRIRRSWRLNGQRIREGVQIFHNGQPDTALSDDWAEHVEALVPRGIAALFFFDGEKIESFAELGNARELLNTAIGGLLGLDLTKQLTTDLSAVERRHRERVIPYELRAEVERFKVRLSDSRGEEERAVAERGKLRVELERAEKSANEFEQQYRFEGGELFEQRKDLEETKKRLTDEIGHAEARLRTIAADSSPLLLLRAHLKETVQRAEVELSAQRQRQLLGLLTERDTQLLRALKKEQFDRDVLARVERLLTTDRDGRQVEAQTDAVVGLDADAASLGRRLLETDLNVAQEEIDSLHRQRTKLREELTVIDRRLGAVPTEDAIKELQNQRDDAHRASAKAAREYRQAEQQLREAQARVAEARRLYDKALHKVTDVTLEVDDSQRIAEHAARVRETLDAFREQATRRNIGRIQTFVLACLQQLLRKQDFITDLQIDPKTFDIALYTRDGKRLQPNQLSAGERQIVAVSLLWGLAQASGRALPVVVDTPLGRLDSSHRAHLVERYFPNASHQVLLLSTDTEIDDPAWRSLRAATGHAYRLEHDSKTGSTSIKLGYFWEGNTHAR